MIIASSADRAMNVREWDPVLQRSAWGYGPCRARSLTVTALSIGEGCFASSWLKFQLSWEWSSHSTIEEIHDNQSCRPPAKDAEGRSPSGWQRF